MNAELEEQTRDAAVRLIKSYLREYVFAEWYKETQDENKLHLVNMEKQHRGGAEEEWLTVLERWSFTTEGRQSAFSKIVADALNRAAVEVIDAVASPDTMALFRRLVEKYIDTFTVDTLLRIGEEAPTSALN